jgi:hypothetical protein
MAYLSGYQYYENSGTSPEDANWGSYQYVSLTDVVNNFMLIYQGNHELVNNINRYQILFHAKRGIQELNYDAFKEIKALELNVCDDLRFVLPPDFVNWVRLSLFKNGTLYPLTENIQANSAESYLQDNNCNILFDESGNILQPEHSLLDTERLAGTARTMYLNNDSIYNGSEGYNIDGQWYFDFQIGARYGLNTETANVNPTFRLDKAAGVINFSSGMAGEQCVLEYISDGMNRQPFTSGDVYNPSDVGVRVHKFFEEFIYAYIKYSILNSRFGVQEYVVRRAQKDKSALLRNAKIRISNLHPARLLMNMRGQNKLIK